jgi:glutamate--cysteine ligase
VSHVLADVGAARPVRTVAEAGTYIVSVCFKHGPPRRTGLELEWLLHDPADPRRTPELATLAAALGAHAPRTVIPDSPARPLPGGGLVTVEPGGQIEISSQPAASVAGLVAAMREDINALAGLLKPTGLTLSDAAIADGDPPPRLLRTPRYDAMASAFDAISPSGRTMMCASAATQVCVDLGLADQAAQRWRAAQLLGPVLLAAFANSPVPGAVSGRMRAWWLLDPARSAPTEGGPREYVRRALDSQVLARRVPEGDWLVREPLTLREWAASGQPLTTADIDLHLSMLFPPVRPQGYLELRYLDAQPAGEWVAPLALIAGLFDGDLDQLIELCAPAEGRWATATEIGLADPVLAQVAADLAAAVRLPQLDEGTEHEVRRLLDRRLVRRISPAMDRSPVREGSYQR